MSPCHCQCQQDQDTVLQNKVRGNVLISLKHLFTTDTSIYAHKCTAALQYILCIQPIKWHVAGLYSLSVLTSAKWCCRLKCCRVAIHCSCTCCHCISDQFKAGITGVGSSVTNGVASECHHAIVNVSRIRTQCYRARCHKCLSTTDTSICAHKCTAALQYINSYAYNR